MQKSKNTSLERQEKQYDERRRRIKWLLAIVLVCTLVAVTLGLWASRRRSTRLATLSSKLPQNVTRRLSGFNYTRTEKGQPVFTIHAARTLAYAGAFTMLEDVHVVIYGPGGKPEDDITAQRCRYENGTGALACMGNAKLELRTAASPNAANLRHRLGDLVTGQPLILETTDVRYDHLQSMVETPDRVGFSMGPASGSAVGLVYNIRTGSLTLRRDVSLVLPPPGRNGHPIHVTAGSLVYGRLENRIALNSPVRVESPNGSVSGSSGTIQLDAKDRLQSIALHSVRARGAGPSEILSTSADEVHFQFDSSARQVRNITATGSVKVSASGAEGRRTLAAESVSVMMSDAGATGNLSSNRNFIVRSVRAEGGVRLDFNPPTPGNSRSRTKLHATQGSRILTAPEMVLLFQKGNRPRFARTIGPSQLVFPPSTNQHDRQTVSAGAFNMQFDGLGRLADVRGSSGTRIVDEPPRSARPDAPVISSADTLAARLDPATGSIEQIRQRGHYEMRDGPNLATATEATYTPENGRFTLSGNPQLSNTAGRIRADHLVVQQQAGTAKAWGNVQTVRYAQAIGDGPGRSATGNPLIVTASLLRLNRKNETAIYTGRVRAWSGADVVEAPRIEIDKQSRRAVATGGVITRLQQYGSTAPRRGNQGAGKASSAAPITIRARRLAYMLAERKASYEGGVTMTASGAEFQCTRLDVYFAASPAAANPQIERAIAEGDVRVMQAGGRHATSNRAEYLASTGEVVLTGGPPAIYDPKQGYLTGKRLTFSTRDASLFADGGNNSQALARRRVTKR